MEEQHISMDDLDNDSGEDLDRLIGLCDGIFAFSMTLLAINVNFLTAPENASLDAVTNAVLDQAPQFVIYATTFLLVALYWQINRRTLRYVVRYDSTFTWIVLVQMLFVAFLPVAAGLFDTYPHVPIVVGVYGMTLSLIGFLGWLWWWYATRPKKLSSPDLDPVLVSYYNFRAAVTLAIYLLLTVTGFLAPDYARRVLLLLVVLYPFMRLIFRKLWQRIPNPQGKT